MILVIRRKKVGNFEIESFGKLELDCIFATAKRETGDTPLNERL
jgi:hypothetical protein